MDGWFIDLIPLKPEVCPKSVLEVLPLSQKVCFFASLLRFLGHPLLCHLKGSFCVVTALSLLGFTSRTVWMGMWGEQRVCKQETNLSSEKKHQFSNLSWFTFINLSVIDLVGSPHPGEVEINEISGLNLDVLWTWCVCPELLGFRKSFA